MAGDKKEFSKKTLDIIQIASVVYVSPISAWEISLKVARKELKLPEEPLQWFESVMDFYHLSLYPLTLAVMCSANDLPWHHKDPADSFIIASALDADAAVVTKDIRFTDYGVKTII